MIVLWFASSSPPVHLTLVPISHQPERKWALEILPNIRMGFSIKKHQKQWHILLWLACSWVLLIVGSLVLLSLSIFLFLLITILLIFIFFIKSWKKVWEFHLDWLEERRVISLSLFSSVDWSFCKYMSWSLVVLHYKGYPILYVGGWLEILSMGCYYISALNSFGVLVFSCNSNISFLFRSPYLWFLISDFLFVEEILIVNIFLVCY